jgi:hypothetical protein
MKRRSALLLLCMSAAGCGQASSRGLVLVDGSGSEAHPLVAARAAAFSSSVREVRVVRASDGKTALALAARGEAEVAVVPASEPLDAFFAANHGREAGRVELAGVPLRIIEIDARTHPKIDAAGAKALAAFLARP